MATEKLSPTITNQRASDIKIVHEGARICPNNHSCNFVDVCFFFNI
jgi:hypothetical protein